MNRKTILLYSIIASILVLFIISCQKFNVLQEDNTSEETSLKNTLFNSEFSWENTRNITINISSGESQIINITSEDGLINYYKGILLNTAETYVVKISVPNHIDRLLINNHEVMFSSENIAFDLGE